MKVDSNAMQAHVPATAPAGPRRDDRWLAQLERAYLDTLQADSPTSRGAADQHEGSPAQARPRAAQAAEDGASTTVVPAPPSPAWSVSSTGAGLPTPAPALQPPGGAYAAFALRGPYGASMTAEEGNVGSGQRAMVLQSLVASPSPQGWLRPASDVAETSAGSAAMPVRYAKQFMQLSISGAAQASVRDAGLSAAGEIAVAHAVAAQLRSDGVELQRVFVNGRRFEADTLRRAAPLPPIPPNHTQE